MRDEIGTCLNVASLKQYGKEMADKGFLSKLLRKFQKHPSYEDVIFKQVPISSRIFLICLRRKRWHATSSRQDV